MTLGPDSARSSPGRFGRWVGALGALVAVPALGGCPGTLDQTLSAEASGSGGGGATPGAGGSTGTGGGASNCTGGNDGATLVTMRCATMFCHIPGAGNDGTTGGLDLTVDANVGARLIGVLPTGDDGSVCGGTTKPYLDANSNPPTGLLIDKITMPSGSPAVCPQGLSMPAGMGLLPAGQQACIKQWAEDLIMAAQ